MNEDVFTDELGISLKEGQEAKAVLVGAYSGGSQHVLCNEHLNELAALADTFGVPVLDKIAAPLRKIDPATYFSEGKLEEIRHTVKEKGATLLIFDEEISPAQQRNLEKFFTVPVMDRTELILEIFAQRAQTKEAKLQIELAKTQYEFPRLKRLWSHFSRQRASGGFLKGEGEKQIEIDRRLLKDKVAKLTAQLKEVQQHRKTQQEQRRKSQIPTFAIVGYTNAGKSTLLNALTDANVLAEDKLFATLDPTTRKCTLPNNQEVLLSDTVGFIRKLPHTLVAAFRSTLEAALHDDVLLHLVDVSHPMVEEQIETTNAILQELNPERSPTILVLNKIDQCEDRKMIDRIRIKYEGRSIMVSARRKEGFEELFDAMIQELASRCRRIHVKIPQSEYGLVTLLHREGNVHFEKYEENDVVMMADIPLALYHKFTAYDIAQEITD
ncbi:MAG: GTPase HflX [Chlamydiales bacterium]